MNGLSVPVAGRRGRARRAHRWSLGAVVLHLLASKRRPGPVGVCGALPREDVVGPALDPAPIGPVLPVAAQGVRVAQPPTSLDVVVLLPAREHAYVQEAHELHVEQAAQNRHGAMLYPLACDDVRVAALLVAVALPPPAVSRARVLPNRALHVVRAHGGAGVGRSKRRGRLSEPHADARPTVGVVPQH